MAIINEKDGSIYIITERHSKNCVVVTGGHRYDILKVLARWSKYFNGGDISVNEITKGTKYKSITNCIRFDGSRRFTG